MPWLTESSSKKKRSRNFRKSFILLSALSMTLSGCALFPKEEIEEVVPKIAPAVKTQKPEYTVKRDTIETKVNADGTLSAKKEETLYFSDASFPIAEMHVEVGQRVEAGDVLVRLDTGDLNYQIKRSEMQLKLAELKMIETLRKTEAEQNSIELEQAKMDFELQKLDHQKLLDKSVNSELVAPFSGEVISVLKKVGDTVEAYKPVVVIAKTDELEIRINVRESEMKNIAVGMPVYVSIQGNDNLEGEIVSIPQSNETSTDPNAPQAPKYVTVKLEQMPADLQRGTSVYAQIVTQRKENVLAIEPQAIRTYNGRKYVQVKDDKGKRDVSIEVGLEGPTKVEIVSGLEEGQTVIGR